MISRTMLMLCITMTLLASPVEGQQATPAAPGGAYEMSVLPGLGGVAAAVDINERGEIVGWGSVPGLGADAALYWPTADTFDVLPTGTGGSASAYAINDAGQIAGAADDERGFTRPVTWVDGEMTDLGTLGGDTGEAAGINNAGQIVGWSETATGEQHATLWDDGEVIDLGIPYGDTSRAIDINVHGEIVGSAWFADDPHRPERPFLWVDGVVTDFGDLDGGGGHAIAVNDIGQVTGHARHPEAGQREPMRGRAFLWEDGRAATLDGLPDTYSWGIDITSNGMVSGLAGDADGIPHAYLWQSGGVTFLDDRGGASSGTSVNDSRVVVGYWHPTPGDFDTQRAVVWRPIDLATPAGE